MKKLNLKIESCGYCPYFHHEALSSVFCNLDKLLVEVNSTELFKSCPLPDCEENWKPTMMREDNK